MVTQSSADFCLGQVQDVSLLDPRKLLSSSCSGIVGLRASALSIPYPSWSWILRVSNMLEGKRTSPQRSTSGAVHWLLIPRVHKANDESDEINVSEGTSFRGAALLIFQATLLPASSQQPIRSLQLRHPRSSYADRDLVRTMPPIAAVCPRSCWSHTHGPYARWCRFGQSRARQDTTVLLVFYEGFGTLSAIG